MTDTSFLLYAHDNQAEEKQQIAQDILAQAWDSAGTVFISVQVLQEFHVNLIRKGSTIEEASEIVKDHAHLPLIENTLAILISALEEQSRWQLSLWDALILSAARASGAITPKTSLMVKITAVSPRIILLFERSKIRHLHRNSQV